MTPRPPMPETVWVAVMTVTSEVAVRGPATTPVAGRASLFAKTSLASRTSAEVVAVTSSKQSCEEALAARKAERPNLQGEDVIVEVPFGKQTAPGPQEVQHHCITCMVPIGEGFYCGKCQKAYIESTRAADPEWDKS